MRRLLLAAILAALLLAPIAHAWTWPASGPVLQPFLFDPAHPFAAGQHRGIDIGGELGAPVPAPAAGTVTFAGTVPSSGKSVTISTAEGYAVTLTHLGSITVTRGAAVAEGDGVGTIGRSGDAEVPQPYLHLGVRVAAHHPVLGVGVGGFRRAYSDLAHLKGKEPKAAASHTTPVTVAAETGVPGLLLFAWLVAAALFIAFRRIGRDFDSAARLAFGLALTAILVHCVFYNALFEDPTFYGLLALIAVGARATAVEART